MTPFILQTRQIARTSSGRNKKEKTFKMDASKQLEEWAAGTKVQGKLMKKVCCLERKRI